MPVRTNLGLARIARETVQERVYCALRDQLMRGGFEPGQKLKIAELAEAFGTSAMLSSARWKRCPVGPFVFRPCQKTRCRTCGKRGLRSRDWRYRARHPT